MPSAPEIVDTLGWILVRQGQLDEGLRTLRDAQSRAARDDPGISYHIGYALNALGRRAEAMVELERTTTSEVADDADLVRARALLEELRAKGEGARPVTSEE